MTHEVAEKSRTKDRGGNCYPRCLWSSTFSMTLKAICGKRNQIILKKCGQAGACQAVLEAPWGLPGRFGNLPGRPGSLPNRPGLARPSWRPARLPSRPARPSWRPAKPSSGLFGSGPSGGLEVSAPRGSKRLQEVPPQEVLRGSKRLKRARTRRSPGQTHCHRRYTHIWSTPLVLESLFFLL